MLLMSIQIEYLDLYIEYINIEDIFDHADIDWY